MPFTISHAAAVLPLRRAGLPFAALVIGSMSPDFLYFIQLGPRSGFGHTFAGLFALDLPLGLVLYGLYHWSLREHLVGLSPTFVQRRVPASRAPSFTFGHIALASAAILVGALTHIAWDTFTHHGAWGVEQLASLREVVSIRGRDVPLYKIAQHASTIGGALILSLAASIALYRASGEEREEVTPLAARVARLMVASCVSLGAGAVSTWWQMQGRWGSERSAYAALVLFVVGAMTAGFVWEVGVSVVCRLRGSSRNRA